MCSTLGVLKTFKKDIFKPSVAVYAYNPSTMEAETRGLKEVEGYPHLHIEYQATGSHIASFNQ